LPNNDDNGGKFNGNYHCTNFLKASARYLVTQAQGLR
jgi:hypothetical protein